ncbi:quinate 5-dehydrogenase [Anaerosporomusa subterranea]|uniref:Quinate 5-dehydrogenase n=1 Tax=Anaerosporomusa subterranea TaxID=1794912 RepID=A0A154BWG2_ANASB|nr:quinate 5-dehydrogenase [Anaerosporomusa subterranea]KYZ78286.1 quinate 5-dehydrogenase [Anaerosporomusa subterranea]
MKRVVSISLGSSKRDHCVEQDFNGQLIRIERMGTDGNIEKAIDLIRALDGKVDAFGLGGTDLYIYAGGRRYTFRESLKIVSAAKLSPIVDGSGVKNTLERAVVSHLAGNHQVMMKDRRVLLVCAVDRFGLAESLVKAGCQVTCGDLMFGLGVPIPIRSLAGLQRLAKVVAPVITKLPVRLFYPTGEKQTRTAPKFSRYFHEAEIIAGDFHFIRRYMPPELPGKIVITNTVTADDVAMLQKSGIHMLVTTTPEMGGRSFGTNVLEGILVALSGKRPENMCKDEYSQIMQSIGIKPRVSVLGH